MKQTIIRAHAGGRIDLAGAWGDGCRDTDPKDKKTYIFGQVANVGLTIGAQVEMRAIQEKGIHVICNGFDEILDEQSDYDGKLDLFVAAARRFSDLLNGDHGWEIRAHSEIPFGSGLGGSAAMAVPLVACVAVALDLRDLGQKIEEGNYELNYVDRVFIASNARALEIEEMEQLSGWQDQWAAAFGGVNFLRAEHDPQKPVRYPILSDPKQIKQLQDHLMLIHTSRDHETKRSSNDQHKKANKAGRFDLLKQIAQQGLDAKDAVKDLDIKHLGQVVDQAWGTIRLYTANAATSAEIDWLIDEAKSLDAYGAKACGAGGPGACVAIVANQHTQELIKQKLVDKPGYQILPVEISPHGLCIEVISN